MQKFRLIFTFSILFVVVAGVLCVRYFVYSASTKSEGGLVFKVKEGESIAALADRLESEGVIHYAWLFKKYSTLKKVDTRIQVGTYTVLAPVTLDRVIDQLLYPDSKIEREVTIIPGWNLQDLATYFSEEGIANEEEFFSLVGVPAKEGRHPLLSKVISNSVFAESKPRSLSFEGYFRPDTFRFYESDTAEEILVRLFSEREKEFTEELLGDIAKTNYSLHEILTLASIVEREVRGEGDRKKVADLFLRRLKHGWPLQADSTVHYVSGRYGDVFTKKTERDVDSPWNTYKYKGLPAGPIAIPSIESIKAVVYPKENPYWYFLTDMTGVVHYGKTLDEHNRNRFTYL